MAQAGRFVALDGLRGVAAATVLFHHIGIASNHTSLFRHGYLAVDLFFTLSGFVIGAAYEGRLAAARFPLLEMLKIRLVRLYPVMALGSLLGFVVVAIGVRPPPSVPIVQELLRQLTFLPTLTPHRDLFQLDGVEWSLMAEIGANLVHAIFLRWLTIQVLWGVVAAGVVGMVVAAVAYGGLSAGWGADNAPAAIARVGFGYSLGVLLHRLFSRGGWLVTPKLPPLLLIAAVPAGALAAQLNLPGGSTFTDLAVALVLYPLIVCFAVSMGVKGVLARLARVAGEISYPLYAIQSPMIWLFGRGILGRLLSGNISMLSSLVEWGAFVIVILVTAWLTFTYIDTPIRRKLGALFTTSAAAPVAPVP